METGPDHRFTYISEGHDEKTKFSRDELIGKTREEFSADLDETEKWAKHREDLEAHVAISTDEARKALLKIGGPVVLTILSADIAHKTEAGGVVLNVQSEDDAAMAFDQILKNVKGHAPEAKIDGVLLQEMSPTGIEMTAGLINAPDFGPLAMVRLGGIFVEVLKDVAFCPAPLSVHDAQDMIDRLKGITILRGTRGQPPADLMLWPRCWSNFLKSAST